MKNNKLLIIGTAIALALSGIAGVASRKSASAVCAESIGTINFNSNAVKINAASVTGDDDLGNTWTVTTVGTTSFTSNAAYYQVGSSKKPATSITFTTTLGNSESITSFSAKFGGFSQTAGNISLKVGDAVVGSGSLNATNDVVVSAPSSNLPQSGTVLTVSVTGIAKGVKAYYISYSYSSDTPIPDPTEISIPESVVIGKGGDYQLTHSFTPSNATGDIIWESDDENVVTVDDEGVITGVSVGTATITASIDGTNLSDTCEVEVLNYGTQANPITVAQAKVALDKTGTNVTNHPLYVSGTISGNDAYSANDGYYKYNVHLNGGFDLYKATYANGVTPPESYETADALAGCDVVAYGYAKIYNGTYELCEASGKTPARPQIVQIATPQNITLVTTELTIEVGDDVEIEFVLPTGASAEDVSWESGDDSIAEVDQYGVVTGMSVGTTTITAQLNDLTSVECEVEIIAKQNYGTVENPITVAQAKAILDITNGEQSRHPLTVRGTVSSNKVYNDSYSNFDDVYLEDGFDLYRVKFDNSVSLEDSYKAVNGMKDYIVVAFGYGKIHNGTYELAPSTEVANPLIKSIVAPVATAIALDETSLEIEVGGTATLKATLTPSNSSSTYTWHSSDETVATVVNGVVTGVATGTATITARVDENVYAECEVTVVASSGLIVTVYKQALFGASYNSKKVSDYASEWSSTNKGFTVDIYHGNNNNNGWSSVKFGNKNNDDTGLITTSTAIDAKIAKITINIASLTSNKVNSIKLFTSLDGEEWEEAKTFVKATGEQTVSLDNPTANLYYQLAFSTGSGGSSNGFIEISRVDYCILEEASALTPDYYLESCSSFASIHGVETSSLETHTYSTTFAKLGYANNAKIGRTDIGPVSLVANKGSGDGASTSEPQYNSNAAEARLYAKNTFKFTSNSGISNITFTFSNDEITNFECSVGTLTGNVWTGENVSEVTFTNTSVVDDKIQIQIKAIQVTCGESVSVDSIAMRFGARISKTTWAELNNSEKEWEIDNYGVMLATKDIMNQEHEGLSIAEAYHNENERRFTVIESGNGNAPFEQGDDYVFTVKVNISLSHSKEYMAAPFIVVDDQYYFLDEMTYSVNSLAAEYLKDGNYPNLSNAALSILAND